MGWTTVNKSLRTDAEILNFLTQELYQPVVAAKMVRGVMYAAVRDRTESVFAVVILTERKGTALSYKVMGEDECPYYFDCPREVFNALTPTTDAYALKWRNATGLTPPA
jgi:hypothetical protein